MVVASTWKVEIDFGSLHEIYLRIIADKGNDLWYATNFERHFDNLSKTCGEFCGWN